MSIEQNQNAYIGDIIGGITKEAAYWKFKCAGLEAQNHKLQSDIDALMAKLPGVKPDAYIAPDHTS